MAVATPSRLQSINEKSDHSDPIQSVIVTAEFDAATVYAQADNAQIDVRAAIQASRRNGKTPTIIGAALHQPARLLSDPKLFVGAKTITFTASLLNFELTQSAVANTLDLATEMANGAVPRFSAPLAFLVSFTEA